MTKPKDRAPATEFKRAADYPRTLWRWPNFTPAEMACKGTGRMMIHPASMDKLQRLRSLLGVPLVIHSAYRTPEHNAAVGGADGSMHLAARAYDVSMSGFDPVEFQMKARACGFTGFGHYPDQGFMHIDTGPARQWGKAWPRRDAPKALTGKAEAEAKAEIMKDLQAVFGRPKVAHPLKRKQAEPA